MRLSLIAITGACLLGVTPAAALAHARLARADPPAGGAVRESPKALRLTFSEPLVLSFSKVQVADAAGHAVATGAAVLDPRDKRVLVEPLKASLGPGLYTVRWRAVSADTHRTEGSYAFRVLP
jgi:methionine-rich copper-binding protein CopC